jgi:hypothetical protein
MTFYEDIRRRFRPVEANGAASVLEASPIDDAVAAAVATAPAASIARPRPLLSPAQQVLAGSIAAHRAALAEMEQAQLPLARLNRITAELAAVEKQIAVIDAEHRLSVGHWIAAGGCDEEQRPLPPAHRLGLAQRRDALLSDVAAVGAVQPDLHAQYQRAAQEAAAAMHRRDEALVTAAADAARDMIERELLPAIENVLRVEARLQGLRQALTEAGNRPHNALPRGAETAGSILELLNNARMRPSIPRADEHGRKFLEALKQNPGERL